MHLPMLRVLLEAQLLQLLPFWIQLDLLPDGVVDDVCLLQLRREAEDSGAIPSVHSERIIAQRGGEERFAVLPGDHQHHFSKLSMSTLVHDPEHRAQHRLLPEFKFQSSGCKRPLCMKTVSLYPRYRQRRASLVEREPFLLQPGYQVLINKMNKSPCDNRPILKSLIVSVYVVIFPFFCLTHAKSGYARENASKNRAPTGAVAPYASFFTKGLSAFIELQILCARRMLSHALRPPRDFGTIWSRLGYIFP